MSWRSILQLNITLSTSEVEYMAIFEAIKEVIWLHGLIEDFGNHQEHDLEIQHN